MRSLKIIVLLLICITFSVQAQKKTQSSKQTRTIDINNLKGKLSLSFEEGEITEFKINGEDVSKEEHEHYQSILDQFTEDIEITPTPPTPPSTDGDENERLKAVVLEYLRDEDIINSATKCDVEIKRKYMKVNGKKVSHYVHAECLDFFDDIYGHRLNLKSIVEFKRKGNKSSSSISIVE